MKIAIAISRYLLGAIFFIFGMNGFYQFIPVPEIPGEAGVFIGILVSSGYIYPIKALEVLGGLALLAGRYVPLGLVLLGPVIVNIVLYHTFLDPANLLIPLIALVLEVFLIWVHRQNFKGVFKAT